MDGLAIQVLLDSSHDVFLRPQEVNGVQVERARRGSDFRRILHNQWGLSLLLHRSGLTRPRTLLLDFGYTAEALTNNMELLGVDPSKIDALILSHGHYDHFGGLIGFLQKYREVMPADLTLYAGGEDNFCHRYSRTPTEGQFTDYGVLDRRELAALRVSTVLADRPTVVSGHAFTTGPIARTSFEKVLPNTMVEYAIKDGLGCDASHFTPAELQGKIVPDEHPHEHATCFNVKDRGLVVITSCGHAGIINTVRQAQEVSGVNKLHALVGGFPSGAGAGPLHRAGGRRTEGARTGRNRPDALQRPELRPGRARADAGPAARLLDRHPPDLRRLTRSDAGAALSADRTARLDESPSRHLLCAGLFAGRGRGGAG